MKYDAECVRCKARKEYVSPITDPDKGRPKCDKCKIKMKRVFSLNAGGFLLKGGGWAKDGYSK